MLQRAIWLDELAAVATLARPKSRILAWPRSVTKMLAGLMSRWTMPLPWAASSASAISMASGSKNFQLERATGDAVLQSHAFEIFHGDERHAVFLADVVNGADVGMVQSRRGLRFALETGESLGIAGHFIGEKLEGDETVQVGVFRLVDDTHPAAAEFLEDAVVRDALADHGAKSYVGETLRVKSKHSKVSGLF